MENIRVIRVYNLVDSKGNKLQLDLGINRSLREERTADPIYNGDTGLRWRFCGKNIPMPVRSRTWFNGFPEDIMLDWLKGNGWLPRTRVEMCDGYAHVYEPANGNEISEHATEIGKRAVNYAIRLLCEDGHRIKANVLYSYVNRCPLDVANAAVREIIDRQI